MEVLSWITGLHEVAMIPHRPCKTRVHLRVSEESLNVIG